MASKANEIAPRATAHVINDRILTPDSMDTDERKAEFIERAEMLREAGMWNELDSDALAGYVLAREQHMRFSSLVSQLIRDGECAEELRSAQILQDTACKQMRGFAADLGMTAAARAKIAKGRSQDAEIDF